MNNLTNFDFDSGKKISKNTVDSNVYNNSIRAADLNAIVDKMNDIINKYNILISKNVELSFNDLDNIPTINNIKISGEISSQILPFIGTDAPSEGGGTDAPSEGGGTDTPSEGGGTDAPSEGGGTDTPSEGGGEINISPVLTSINTFTTIEINKTIATVNVSTDNDSVDIGTLNVSCTNLPDGLTCKLNDSNEIIIARNSYYPYY